MAPVFTNVTRATVSVDAIAGIRNEIIDTILLTSTANRTVVAPIINHMLLSIKQGNPVRKYAVRTPSTLTTALNAVVAATGTRVVFHLNTTPVFVNPNTYKMTKIAPGPNSTKRALHHGQGMSIDFSFFGVKSKTTG